MAQGIGPLARLAGPEDELMDTRRVKELMLPLDQYATTRCRSTIREALLALSKAQLGLTNDRHHHRAILVRDDDGKVVGKLTHWSILKHLLPRALSNQDQDALARTGLSPEFIESLAQCHPFRGSMEQMSELADRIRVCDAMVPVVESIDENARMSEAIVQMVDQHMQSILVTSGGEVVGILRLSDVFEEVADLVRGLSAG